MTQDKINAYWTQSWTESQKGKPTRYRIGYGSNRHGDGDAGEVCKIETDDKAVADFILAAPDMYLALGEVMLYAEEYCEMTGEKMSWLVKAQAALAKARGER